MSSTSIDKITKYNQTLNTLIATYKPQITILTENYDHPIGSFIIEIEKLIKTVNSKREDGLYTNMFLIKSFLCLLLQFYEYETIDNGKLLGNSSNCKFTVANVRSNHGGTPYKLFVKVIDYSTQQMGSRIDLSIYDVLTSIIFDKIFSIENYKKFKDFIPEYKGDCLSYIKGNRGDTYWDFNEIKRTTETDLTYYNGRTLELNSSPLYKYPAVLVMFEAINNPITVNDVFKFFSDEMSDDSINLVIGVLSNAYDIYNFLETVGSDYGFMHNDLHFSNIIYDQTKNKLVIIDFGRCVFSKFKDELDSEINNKILTEFKKLNYNISLDKLYLTDSITPNKVERLYKRDIFRYHISIIGNNTNYKYFGVIYDLITYSLNMYIRFLYYLRKTDTVNADNVEDYYSLLIKVNYRSLEDLVNQRVRLEVPSVTIRQLMNNYLKIKSDFIDKTYDEDARNYFIMLLNGLFYTALLLHFTGKNYAMIYTFFQVKAVSLPEFYKFIEDEIFSNKDYLNILKNDLFLMQFLQEPQVTTGGFVSTIYPQPIVEVNKAKSKSKSKPTNMSNLYPLFSKENIRENTKIVSLQETCDAYKKIYDDKEIFDLIPPPIKQKGGGKKLKNYSQK